MVDFPGGPLVKTSCFHCRGKGLIHGQETKISHAMHPETNTSPNQVIMKKYNNYNSVENYEENKQDPVTEDRVYVC